MPININQDNLLKRKEIHANPSLWKDKIYYLERNPYWNNSYKFIPTPKKYAAIIQEFHAEIDKQKKQVERAAEDKEKAQRRISEIYLQIKEIIQEEIEFAQSQIFQATNQSQADGIIKELTDKIKELKEILARNKLITDGVNADLANKSQKLNSLKAKLTAQTIKVPDWTKWKDIDRKFTEELVREWVKYGFSYNQAFDWVRNIGLSLQNAEYAYWLDKVVEIDCEYYLNYISPEEKEDLEEQFAEWKNNNQQLELPTEQLAKEIQQLETEIAELSKSKKQLEEHSEYLTKELVEINTLLLEEANKKPLESNEAKAERIKQLELGLKQRTASQFKRFNQEVLNNDEEINKLLEEWEECKQKTQADYNSCFILEHGESSLVFTFQPPRQIFVNLKEFLFYRNNTWYEVVDWRRINDWNAVIICKRSIFLSYYHYFLAKGANGIMHCSPRIAREICQCPTFLESTQTEEYNCDWEPKYGLWKIVNNQSVAHTLDNPMNRAPYISAVKLEEVTRLSGWDSLSDTTYLLLPEGYDDQNTFWSNSSYALGKKVTFTNQQIRIFNEEQWQKHTNNELNYHTKSHVSLQFFWRKKIIGKYNLTDFDPNNCFLKIKANGSSILYDLQSKNIALRWSEDVKVTIEKDRIVGIVSGIVNKFTGAALSDVTKSLFHDLNTEESKAQDERESERRTKYDGTAQVVSSVMGSLPSMLATSHTKLDYTSAEFALRYEQPSLKIRIQYNQNTFDRYKMEKDLKRNGNEWFNWEKIGNYLNKGYWKIVPHIFEFDKEGFFANIFSQGVYLYENHPHEYFTTKLEGGKYTSNVLVGGNPQIESVFQRDLEETGGHDDHSQAGGGLWVYKNSYIKRKGGSGDNIFATLMNQANAYRNHSHESGNKWVFKHPQTWSTEINMDEYAEYVYDLHFYSSDRTNTRGVKGATKIVAEQVAEGNRSAIKVRFIGELEIKKGQDDPKEIGTSLPGSGGTEQMPEIQAENNDEALNDLEKTNQPEAEQTSEQDRELLDELQKQPEAEDEQTQEKQDELEPEPEASKDKQKQEEKPQEEERAQEDEDVVERSNEK